MKITPTLKILPKFVCFFIVPRFLTTDRPNLELTKKNHSNMYFYDSELNGNTSISCSLTVQHHFLTYVNKNLLDIIEQGVF